MMRMPEFALDYYDKSVVSMIIDKYDMDPMDATRSFVTSRTHALLEDLGCALWQFGPSGVFDMREVEQVTGDPRNSVYVREE